MNACFISDVGKVRKVNEDSGGIFYNQSEQMLTVIADGMGGHKAGDVASELTASYLKQIWEETSEFQSIEDVKGWLHEAVKTTNEYVLTHAKDHKECFGMGTTVVATVYMDDTVIVAHVGDSRLYHISVDEIKQITLDHSFVQELVNNGEITEEEAEAHPKKNVLLQAIGTEANVRIDVNSFQWNDEEYVLSCTDGLSNKLSDQTIQEILISNQSLDEKVNTLVSLANDNGGEDNISVIVVQRRVGEAS